MFLKYIASVILSRTYVSNIYIFVVCFRMLFQSVWVEKSQDIVIYGYILFENKTYWFLYKRGNFLLKMSTTFIYVI